MTYEEYLTFMATYRPTVCPCSERWFDDTYIKDFTIEHYSDLWKQEQAFMKLAKTVAVPDGIVRKVKK